LIVPIEFGIALLFAIGVAVWMHCTVHGRRVFAIGSNPLAARFSGVAAGRYRFGLFVFAGIAAALAAAMLTGRIGSTRPNLAAGWELDAITIALLGGVAIQGGRGSLVGVMLAAVLLGAFTFALAMLNVPGTSAEDVASLRFCYSAGEALPKELYERWMNTFGVDICDGIGSAEMFHIYITNRPGNIKPGSLGRIVAGYEAKIVDAESNEVATGEMGTLKIKGDSAALCYWNAHDKSKETFAGDWCTTGDQFHVDEDGYYWYHGRTDDMLKVSGVFVAPAEIENCLLQHEAVLECAVVGHESEGLVKPKAFVVLREGFAAADQLAEEIKQFVKDHIAIYKYPRWIEFVDSLPKNDRGKIDRKKLKS